MSNNYSYRLMNDSGSVDIPLSVAQSVHRKYIDEPIDVSIEETWRINLQGETWLDIEAVHDQICVAMKMANLAIDRDEEDDCVWLEITRPDASVRRVLLYGGSLQLLDIGESVQFTDGHAEYAFTFRRHPLVEASGEDVSFNSEIVTAYSSMSNVISHGSMAIASRVPDINPGSEDIVPTVAPARIKELKIEQPTTASEGGSISSGWVGIRHQRYLGPDTFNGDLFGDDDTISNWLPADANSYSIPYQASLGSLFTGSQADVKLFNPGRYAIFAPVAIDASLVGVAYFQLEFDGKTGPVVNLPFDVGIYTMYVNLGVFEFPTRKGPLVHEYQFGLSGNFRLNGDPASTFDSVDIGGGLYMLPDSHYLAFNRADCDKSTSDDIVHQTRPWGRVTGFSDDGTYVNANHGISTKEWYLPQGVNLVSAFLYDEDTAGYGQIDTSTPVFTRHKLSFVMVPRFYSF